jgi:hypothetical protein
MLPELSTNLPLAVAALAQGSKGRGGTLVFDFEEAAGKNNERGMGE